MKRIFLLILGILCLCSCNSKEVSVKSVCDYYTNLERYQTEATMNMYRSDEVVSFNVSASYLAPNYYMVSFTNNGNSNEQIIVKNDEGVFVLTPTLNKQFKFDSDWPLNSSHAYLLSAIVKDICNDSEAIISEDDDIITIKSKILHKVNQSLTYMKFTCKEDYTPISCNFYNANDEKKVEVSFISFNPKPELSETDFNAEAIMDEKTSALGEGGSEAVNGNLEVSYLEDDSNMVVIEYDDRVVATYTGENSFVVVSQTVEVLDEVANLRIYDDFDITILGVVGITKNSLTYFYKNQQITIYSNSLTVSELIEVGASITFA